MTRFRDPHNILVTGGAGFIGSNFVRYVLNNNPDVHITVLDALTYAGNINNLNGLPEGRYTFVHGNICDADLLDTLIPNHDTVINFAAESHNDNSIAQPDIFITSNIVGTFTLLQAVARHHIRFHQVSTDEVYGDTDYHDRSKFTQFSPYHPSSPYSASKASADMLVQAWIRTYGVAATISNSSNNYGPYQHVEKFIPRQITNLLSGRRAKLYGEGKEIRDWIAVEDNCSAIWQIVLHGTIGKTYLVSADCEKSNRDVLHSILRLMGRAEDDYDAVSNRPGVDRRYALNSDEIRKEFGWKPEFSNFEAGLQDTIDWYAQHEEWWQSSKQATEQKYAKEHH
ncbi:dTDP-glucose 4,6-dehydratase [Bifidobacterium aquikefiricola]|uniref:dTDP-glucose 4,6-dehydratase n=1 Tax=Bifidobacterium aquikefiricola TaxID=3059038 RepID=A0AB39U5Y3_9BIFI